jgi:hypothetical protein
MGNSDQLQPGGAGGAGLSNSITGTSITYAAGGSGAGQSNPPSGTAGASGTVNRGNGGGGANGQGNNAGSGGSGVAVITHPGAFKQASTTGANVTVTNDGTNYIYIFYSSGTITF